MPYASAGLEQFWIRQLSALICFLGCDICLAPRQECFVSLCSPVLVSLRSVRLAVWFQFPRAGHCLGIRRVGIMDAHEHFMQQAVAQAARALDAGQFPVGCVMAYQSDILVTGARSRSGPERQNELDHAEMTALRRLVDLDPPVDRKKVVVYSTLEPCLMCYSALIVNGIRKIAYAYEDVFGGGTDVDLSALRPCYRDLAIEVVPGVLRHESLALFKRFFSDPNNGYLKNTPLAEHALAE